MRIYVISGKPEIKNHDGIVTAFEPFISITIKTTDGTEQAFLLTPESKILLKERSNEPSVDRRVTIISRRDPTGGPFTAQGIVVHPITGEGSPTPSATPTDTPTATPTPTVTPTEEGSPTQTPTSS